MPGFSSRQWLKSTLREFEFQADGQAAMVLDLPGPLTQTYGSTARLDRTLNNYQNNRFPCIDIH